MDELITFLRARESEREAMANELIAKHGVEKPFSVVSYYNRDGMPNWESTNAVLADKTGEWVERSFFMPKDVLADVEAKRRIIDQYENHSRAIDLGGAGICTRYLADELRKVLQALALPYAGHPDYQEGWKP